MTQAAVGHAGAPHRATHYLTDPFAACGPRPCCLHVGGRRRNAGGAATRSKRLTAAATSPSVPQHNCATPPRARRQATLSSVVVNEANKQVVTQFVAETLLPTKTGRFRLRGYKHSVDGGKSFTEPTAIICGAVEGRSDVPVRVHDACYTSEVLGSLKCDCADQLQLAMRMIQDQGLGAIIYLQQEGRGIGLANKIAAYALQEKGLDTVDANRALGFPDDCREYSSVQNILRDLNIKSIQLMTNNPRKMKQLNMLGINIVGRIPVIVKPGKFNQGYLQTKAERMDHVLAGDFCYWNHEGEPSRAVVTKENISRQMTSMEMVDNDSIDAASTPAKSFDDGDDDGYLTE